LVEGVLKKKVVERRVYKVYSVLKKKKVERRVYKV
jgi:hypothetical protein